MWPPWGWIANTIGTKTVPPPIRTVLSNSIDLSNTKMFQTSGQEESQEAEDKKEEQKRTREAQEKRRKRGFTKPTVEHKTTPI